MVATVGSNRFVFDDEVAPAAPAPSRFTFDDDEPTKATARFTFDDEPQTTASQNIASGAAPTPPEGPRTGNVATDLFANLALGGAGLISMFGSLQGMLTGQPDNAATRLGEKSRKAWQAELSPEYDALEKQRATAMEGVEGTGVGSEIQRAGVAMWETLKSPRLLAGFAMQQAPQFGLLGPGARAGAAIGRSVATTQASRLAMEKTAAEALAKEGAAKGAVAAGTAGEAVLQGADTVAQTAEQLKALPKELWESNPDVQAGMAEWDAAHPDGVGREAQFELLKNQQITSLSRKAFTSAALFAIATAFIPGATTLERKLGGVDSAVTGPTVKKAIVGGLGEAGQQGSEEGGGALFANIATKQIDPNQEVLKGVGEQFGMGALFGIPGTVAGLADAALAPPPVEKQPTDKSPAARLIEQYQKLPKSPDAIMADAVDAAAGIRRAPDVQSAIATASAELDDAIAPHRLPELPAADVATAIDDAIAATHTKSANLALSAPEPNEYASTQVALGDAEAAQFKTIALTKIDPADVHEKGLEDRPHITALYGLDNEDPEPVRQLLGDGPIEATVGPVMIFEPEGKDYDVVVQSVDSEDLQALNKKLRELPNHNTFPNYQPHITLGYVKKGTGQKYANLQTGLEGRIYTFDTLEHSTRDERITRMDLAGQPIPVQTAPERQPEKPPLREGELANFHDPESNLTSYVFKSDRGGFGVGMRDEDSGNVLPSTVHGIDTIEAAAERAQAMLGAKPEPKPTGPVDTGGPLTISVEHIHGLAESKGIEWDGNAEFARFTAAVVGKRHLDELTPLERTKVWTRLANMSKATYQAFAAKPAPALVSPDLKKITFKENAELDTGETVEIRQTADSRVRKLSKRINVVQQLLECVS